MNAGSGGNQKLWEEILSEKKLRNTSLIQGKYLSFCWRLKFSK